MNHYLLNVNVVSCIEVVHHCCRICVIPKPQHWVVVRESSVHRAGKELEAA